MESHVAATHTERAVSFRENLADIHGQIHIEFAAGLFRLNNLLVHLFEVNHVIDSGAAAWSQEAVIQFLADDDVVNAHFGEEKHSASDFRIAKQGGASHCVVPVSVDPLEWKNGCEAAGAQAFHRNS